MYTHAVRAEEQLRAQVTAETIGQQFQYPI